MIKLCITFIMAAIFFVAPSLSSAKNIISSKNDVYKIISVDDFNNKGISASKTFLFGNNKMPIINGNEKYAVALRYLNCGIFFYSTNKYWLKSTKTGILFDKNKNEYGYSASFGDIESNLSDVIRSQTFNSGQITLDSIKREADSCERHVKINGGAPVFFVFVRVRKSTSENHWYDLIVDDVKFSNRTISTLKYAISLWLSDFTAGVSDFFIDSYKLE